MKLITWDNFSLDEVQEQDHEWLVELHNDPLVLMNITNPEPISLSSHMQWWNSLNFSKEKRYIFSVDGVRVGFTKFYSINKLNSNCLLGADIHKDFRGMGYAKYMWKMMLHYSFYTLDLWRVGITVAEYNPIARHTYSELGFVEEGRMIQSLKRDDKYHDQLCMYMTKDMYVPIL